MKCNELIKKIRIEKGITQRELAGDVFSRAYISQIERGLTTPSLKAINHFSMILNVPTFHLLENKVVIENKSSDEIKSVFFSARKKYKTKKFQQCIEEVETILKNQHHLDTMDIINSKIWLADSYLELGKLNVALKYSQLFFDESGVYSRYEIDLRLRFKWIEGSIYYYKGDYKQALKVFKFIETTIKKERIDPEIEFVTELYSWTQLIYQYLGNNPKRKEYHNKVAEISKLRCIITPGTLRSECNYFSDFNLRPIKVTEEIYERIIKSAMFVNDWSRVLFSYNLFIVYYFSNHNHIMISDYLLKVKEVLPLIQNKLLFKYHTAYYKLYKGKLEAELGNVDGAWECLNQAFLYIEGDTNIKSLRLKTDLLFEIAKLYFYKKEYESALMYLQMTESASNESGLIRKIDELNELRDSIAILLNVKE